MDVCGLNHSNTVFLLKHPEWSKTDEKGVRRKDNEFGSGHIVSQIQVTERYSYGDI